MKHIYVAFKVCILFFAPLLMNNQAHAQRVYAPGQVNGVTGLCLFCGVQNPGNAVDSTNLDNYSQFNITAGLLGVSVHQTLIFPNSTTGCDSVVIRIGSSDAVLSAELFGGVSVETFNGAISNNDSQLISSSVLRLLENNTVAEVVLHPTGSYDRVKLRLHSNLLGLLNSFRVYYAFRSPGKPAAPIYTPPSGLNCGDKYAQITNHKDGNNYVVRLVYRDLFLDPFLDTTYTIINNDSIFIRDVLGYSPVQTDMYVTAINPFTGCASDTVQNVMVFAGHATLPSVDDDSMTICKGDSTTLHAFISFSAFPQIRWYDAPSGGNLLHIGNFFKVSPSATTTYYVTAASGCEYPQRVPVTVFITKLPDPAFTVPTTSICTDAQLLVTNHQGGLNYRVRVIYTGVNSPTIDTSYLVVNDDTIPVRNLRRQPTITAAVYVQAVNPVTNCLSDTVMKQVIFGGSAPGAQVDPDSATICSGDSITLRGFVPATTLPQIRWYNVPTGGTILATGEFFKVSPPTTTIYWVGTAFACEYAPRTPVYVAVIECLSRTAKENPTHSFETPAAASMKVFPNPTGGDVYFSSPQNVQGALLTVCDFSGKTVKQEILRGNSTQLRLSPGLYMLYLQTSDRKKYQQLIVIQK